MGRGRLAYGRICRAQRREIVLAQYADNFTKAIMKGQLPRSIRS